MRPISISSKLTTVDNDSLKAYFREISAYKPFTTDEEAKCAYKAYLGDEKAREELVKRNLRFIISVAKQYANKDNPLGDLINEGNLGMIEAAKRFKPDMGFKFISYGVWWVRKYINEYLSNNSKCIRIPANKFSNLSAYNKKVALLEQKMGRTVDVEEVIQEYKKDFSEEEIKSLDILNTYSVDSLDRKVSNQGEVSENSLSDLIADDGTYKATDFSVMNKDIKTEIEAILNTLKEKERYVLVSLFGLNGDNPKTLNEVGLDLNMTREAVRLIKERTLKKIKQNIKGYEILTNHSF